MNKKVILIYPYYRGISGAYNRYLLLERLIRRNNLNVKLIILKNKKHNSTLFKVIYKFFRFLRVESLIFFYSIINNHYLITDFNPSIIALFSRYVFIQIHDVSWVNKKFVRHNLILYKILKIFIRYYQNIITVSRTSMVAINKASGRKKMITYIYNSVNQSFITESNKIGQDKTSSESVFVSKNIGFDIPNILYIATLTPRKCHLEFFEALSKSDNFFNVNFVGLPNDKKIFDYIQDKKQSFAKQSKSKINYFPSLSQKDLCYLMLYSSAYISTSKDEGFGIPVLEAQIYNIPLIIRDIDINRELFPKAIFFKSNFQLVQLLNNIKPLSKSEIKKRKNIISKINEDNIVNNFKYSSLSKDLRSRILF
jgi:hypothetical protein